MRISDWSSDVCSSDLLVPESVLDKVVSQKRRTQQPPQLHASLIDWIALGGRTEPRKSCHRTGMSAHDRGCQVHQTIPMLFDQSDVDIGFAHRSDFCGHFGAACHKEVALFEFLRSE